MSIIDGAGRRAALGLALALPALRRGRAQAPAQLAIGTGTTGGVYYPLGGAIAGLLSRQVARLSATVEVTGGSVANLQLLGAGRVGLAFTQVDAAVDALRGLDRFRGRPVPARALAVIYSNRMQVVTTAASGIRGMADLRGKRISTGAPVSATEVMAARLIEAAGLDLGRDFRARERLSPAESTNAVKDGKLDAYFFVSGVPTSAVTDLAASPGVRMVLIDHADLLPRLIEKHGPVYFAEDIPANTYPGQSSVNHQVSVANILAVREDMPDAQALDLLRVTWEGREQLAQTHAEARNFRLESQRTAAAGVPWHPAAERYWREQGATLA